jgi:hypothetical protein
MLLLHCIFWDTRGTIYSTTNYYGLLLEVLIYNVNTSMESSRPVY